MWFQSCSHSKAKFFSCSDLLAKEVARRRKLINKCLLTRKIWLSSKYLFFYFSSSWLISSCSGKIGAFRKLLTWQNLALIQLQNSKRKELTALFTSKAVEGLGTFLWNGILFHDFLPNWMISFHFSPMYMV